MTEKGKFCKDLLFNVNDLWQSGHRTADSNEICDVPQSIERPSIRETQKTQAGGCPHSFPDPKRRRHSHPPKTNRCVVLRGKWKKLVEKIPGYRALSFPQSPAGIHRRQDTFGNEVAAHLSFPQSLAGIQRRRVCPCRRKCPRPSFSLLDRTRPRQVWDSNPINSDSWCSVRDLRFPPYIYPDSGWRRHPTYGGANPGVLVRPHVFDFCNGLFLVRRGQGRERRRPAPFHPNYACQ